MIHSLSSAYCDGLDFPSCILPRTYVALFVGFFNFIEIQEAPQKKFSLTVDFL